MTSNTTKIPLSQVVHADIDDEVSTIFEQIAKKKYDLVYVIVPLRAVLFQSIVNVKILKRKAKDIGKEIAFITKDKGGVHFANQCEISVFDNPGKNKKNLQSNDIPDNILTTADKEKSRFTDAKPIKSSTPKTSIATILKKLHYKNYAEKISKFFYKLSRKKSRQQYAQKLLMSNPNRTLLISLIVGSLTLLSLIAYIALPSATIVLKPNSVPIERSLNLTLADAKKNAGLLRTRPQKTIASYQVSPGVAEITINYNATGNDLTGENAKGLITVYNKLAREFPLVPYTRFQTQDGIVFRTQAFVVVPAGNKENPSQITIEILADPVDVNNLPIGERGNLPPNTKLTIPGLNFVSAEDLYAMNPEPFTGGISSKDKIVTVRDLEAAKEFATVEFKNKAPQKLQEYLLKFNNEHNLTLSLLDDAQLLTVGEIQVAVDESIVGSKMNSFTVSARAEISGIAYDHKEFLAILKNELQLRKSPDKILTKIDDAGVSSRILKNNPEVGLVDITATIRAVEQFAFNAKTEEGQLIIAKVKDKVAGLEITEARKLIESMPEIESVKITTWPFWAPTIPGRHDSIELSISD